MCSHRIWWPLRISLGILQSCSLWLASSPFQPLTMNTLVMTLQHSETRIWTLVPLYSRPEISRIYSIFNPTPEVWVWANSVPITLELTNPNSHDIFFISPRYATMIRIFQTQIILIFLSALKFCCLFTLILRIIFSQIIFLAQIL